MTRLEHQVQPDSGVNHGAIPLDEALTIAKQIGEALEAAVVSLRAFAAKAVPLLWDGQAFARFVNESAGTPLEQVRRNWLARIDAAR